MHLANFYSKNMDGLKMLEVATGSLKDYVANTAPLSASEMSVGKAFYILFGRAPDSEGLAYWAGEVGPNASLATAIDKITYGISGSYVIDPDNRAFIALIYNNLFSKASEEDPDGVAYWISQLNAGATKGTVARSILNAIVGISGYHSDTARNRLLVV